MALKAIVIEIITEKITSVLHNNSASTISSDKRVSCLDVIVNDITRQDSTFTLWKIECGKLINTSFSRTGSCGRWIINIENAASKARTHLTPVISIHS